MSQNYMSQNYMVPRRSFLRGAGVIEDKGGIAIHPRPPPDNIICPPIDASLRRRRSPGHGYLYKRQYKYRAQGSFSAGTPININHIQILRSTGLLF